MTLPETTPAPTPRRAHAVQSMGRGRLLCASVVGATMLASCSPSLDWREVRVTDGQVKTLFPCRPESRVRQVLLAGVKLEMHLESCTAAGANYALSHVNVGDATHVEPALRQLQSVFASNIGGTPAAVGSFNVPGTTPNPLASRMAVTGSREDGSAIAAEAVFFARGTVIYQATTLGARLGGEATDTFFAGLSAL